MRCFCCTGRPQQENGAHSNLRTLHLSEDYTYLALATCQQQHIRESRLRPFVVLSSLSRQMCPNKSRLPPSKFFLICCLSSFRISSGAQRLLQQEQHRRLTETQLRQTGTLYSSHTTKCVLRLALCLMNQAPSLFSRLYEPNVIC